MNSDSFCPDFQDQEVSTNNAAIPRRNPGDFYEVNMEYTNSQMRELIDEYIHSERDRAILKRRLIDGLVYEKLAEEFDMSVNQIRRIIYRTQDIVFRHF